MKDNSKKMIGVCEHSLKVCLDNLYDIEQFIPPCEYHKYSSVVKEVESLIDNSSIDKIKDTTQTLKVWKRLLQS